MAFAETANLAIKLTVGGNFKSAFSNASKQLRGLDKDASRAYKAGTQIGTGIQRSAILVVAAAGTIAGALAYSIKVGQEAANTQKIYAQALANSSKAAAQTAEDQKKHLSGLEKILATQKKGSKGYKQVAGEIADLKAVQQGLGPVSDKYIAVLNAQQTALMNLGGVDDELIKSEQTRLIQFGLNGKAVSDLTPLILDASKATGKDLLPVTIAAGKAALGNAGALQKLGIFVDKARFKVNPLAETIRTLNERFGGTTKALSGSFDVKLAALRENLNNIAEDVGIKLLPALTRIVSVVGTKLVPALGKAVDIILPDVIKNFDDFAAALESGKAQEAIKGITDSLGPMVDLIKIAATPVKEIVKAFLSLPKEVQTVLIGAFAVNKLTGGLVTNVAGGLVESLGKALIGGVKAPLVNVEGAVVNVNGGIGGSGADAILKTAAAGFAVSTGAAIALIAASVVGTVVATLPFLEQNNRLADKNFSPQKISDTKFDAASPADKQRFIKAGFGPNGDRRNNLSPVSPATAQDLNEAGRHIRDAARTLNGADASAARSVASAAMRLDAQPANVTVTVPSKVNVYVTAGGIKRTVNYTTRHGRSSGSRSGGTAASSARQTEGIS